MRTLTLLVIVLGATAPPAEGPTRPGEAEACAEAFLGSLREEQHPQAALPFDSAERANWRFVPGRRAGLLLKAMDAPQRSAAHALFRTALSPQGYLKAAAVMSLDQVLREQQRSASRDEEAYAVALFGTPSDTAPWGWRLEGHHLSVNVTRAGTRTSVTPAFFGANPAEIRQGPRAGLEVLAAEEELGRRLYLSLDEEQRKLARIGDDAPADIILGPGRNLLPEGPRGIAAARLSPDQRAVLRALIETYAGNFRPDLGRGLLDRMLADGIEAVHFAWAGGTAPGEGHYYRIQRGALVIEYDNTQDGANHIHTVWRDLENDFGADDLRRHLEEHHRPK